MNHACLSGGLNGCSEGRSPHHGLHALGERVVDRRLAALRVSTAAAQAPGAHGRQHLRGLAAYVAGQLVAVLWNQFFRSASMAGCCHDW